MGVRGLVIVLSRDAAWLARLARVAVSSGWRHPSADGVVVIDEPEARAVAAARAAHPGALVLLACAESELAPGRVDSVLRAGADDTLSKACDDGALARKLAALRERARPPERRESPDGLLAADRSARRAFARGKDAGLSPVEFSLLWRLLEAFGAPVTREQLIDAVREDLGRELEPGTVARRVLALRRALKGWPGAIASVRGGAYRLEAGRS